MRSISWSKTVSGRLPEEHARPCASGVDACREPDALSSANFSDSPSGELKRRSYVEDFGLAGNINATE
jgi:hypothetical protein